MGQFGDGFDVDHLKRGVGNGFKEHRAGFIPDRRLPCAQIAAVDEGDLNPIAAKDFFEHIDTGAE